MEPLHHRKQRIVENTSHQYSDMAAHTPLRAQYGAGTSSGDGSRKQQPQTGNESTS